MLANYDDGRKENTFVKTQKSVLASQTTNEDNTHYLVRVERLSQDAGFEMVLLSSVNGLIDTNMRVEQMANLGLNWEKPKLLFMAKSLARQAADVLNKNMKVQFFAK